MAEVREERRTIPARERDGDRERLEEQRYQTSLEAPAMAVNRVSWGAILAGTGVGLVVQLVMSILGIAIGLTLAEPVTGEVGLQTIGIAVGIWWIITALVSLFLGGWTAGRLSGMRLRMDAILHGIMTWAVISLIGFYLVTIGADIVMGGQFLAIAEAATATAAAWWVVIALLVGAVAAAAGAALGADPKEVSATTTTSTGARRRA
jgi:hypothetical protein